MSSASSPPRQTGQTSDKPLINLIRGWPNPDLHPNSLLSSAAQTVLSDPSTSVPALQYGPDSGYQPLREALATWLTRRFHGNTDGSHAKYQPDPERICITGGASQNLANILASFSDPVVTRAVWMAAPCYHLACGIFEDAGFKGRLKAVPEDEDGIDVDVLERKISALEKEEEKSHLHIQPLKDPGPSRKHYRHIIYLVATCSNPSGKTLPLARREALVKLARRHDALLISDDVYDFLQWPAATATSSGLSSLPDTLRIPRLCDVDRSIGLPQDGPARFGYAVSNGSFSKIAGPGVRTGWLEGTPAFAHGLGQTAATRSGGAPSQFCAAMMSELVESGSLEQWINTTTVPALQRRHKLIMDAVKQYIAPVANVTLRESSLSRGDSYGGYFIWFTLPDGLLAKRVADVALKTENLVIAHGNMFEVKGDEDSAKFDHDVRLCFSWEPEEALVEGVKRLGRVVKRVKDGDVIAEEANGDETTNTYK
ncbi:aminotransferase class I and II domain-containing protein [Sarocladium implicatum]|nr:aminotransferase class I and II domain-containing protein [Sarocladium implicatum]